jgi:signal transduction histidine kinase
VSVSLAEDGGLDVRVADDGIGIAPEAMDDAAARGSLGLAYARERVEALGGSLRVLPGLDGRGSCVAVSLPS